MKKVYLVHRWEGTINSDWYPWLAKTLNNKGINVIMIDMPDTIHPKIDKWVNDLDKIVGSLDRNTYFIGHSIGCQTIMRYLETKDITKIGGILFVAPWFVLLPEAISDKDSFITAKPWLETSINLDKIKKFTNNINCIFSSNDYFVSVSEADKFKNELNTNNIILKDKGHITEEDGVYESKEILDIVLEMINN